MELSVLEVLYIFLMLFLTVIGTLLSIILYKTIKILKVVQEVVGYYSSIKNLVIKYATIPDFIIERIQEKIQESIDSFTTDKNKEQ